jgi:hypothetical protein
MKAALPGDSGEFGAAGSGAAISLQLHVVALPRIVGNGVPWALSFMMSWLAVHG